MAILFDTSWLQACQLIDGDKFESLNNPKEKITYLSTDAIIELLKLNSEVCSERNILITHNSDHAISKEIIEGVGKKVFPCHWFAQNVMIKHPKITPLPIGLERIRWFPHIHKRDILLKNMKLNIKPEKLCLANFSLNTNYTQRKKCLEMCRSFSTVDTNISVMFKSYTDFTLSILNHYFVLCPEGNGIDTHRLWETLYLGRIPVVTHNITIESFKDLPILIIPSWDYLTRDILINFLKNFKAGQINYSLDKLNFQYWNNIIKGKICHL